ncbi:Crp/Fnr family transcriptional regulator [Roseibium sp. SCP14]|uniref:Crp/Fnr family transcriptional regulator n=1 Tax=Roseibium sp. SCP14 TaxID=3141375 RepID=UPI00333B8F3F
MIDCDLEEKSQIVRAFCDRLQLLSGSQELDMQPIFGQARVKRVEPGEILFAAGDRLEDLYFIISGLVRYFYVTPDGREFNKNFVTKGSVVTCLSSFLQSEPSPFFTESLEETLLVCLPMDLVRSLRADDFRWERIINGFIVRLALQKEQREASFLLDDATKRYEAFLKDFASVSPRLPQYHIASYLGITPVALSRIRGRRAARNTS